MSEHDYASEGGKVAFDPYFKPEKVEGVKFVPGESGTPNNVGQEIPKSALASDQAEFTGPEILFSKNANNFSEDKGLPYNKGDEVGV
mgnify:FL=1